jgi:hypothetical protein
MQLDAGCSKSHHTNFALQIRQRINARAARMFPSLTAFESDLPRGRVLLLKVEPRLLMRPGNPGWVENMIN